MSVARTTPATGHDVPTSGLWPEAAAKAALREAGIRTPQGLEVTDVSDVPATLSEPLVLKVVSKTLAHKSDAGGVKVGLTHADLPTAAEAVRESVQAAGHDVSGFLVEEMVPAGEEVVVGAVRRPGVGWTVMVGLGGVFVEVLADVAFGAVPLQAPDVRTMIDSLRGAALLRGVRGRIRVDEEALVDLVVALAGPGGLLESIDEHVVEIDLNPVIVAERGAVAVDARFVAQPEPMSGVPAVRRSTFADFEPLYNPKVVAVLGAKSAGVNGANIFLQTLKENGFTGRLVPVHPKADVVEGLPAVSSLAAVGEPVDYAYVALPAARVADALTTDPGQLRFAQVVSSGFSEIAEGRQLEADLVTRMAAQGTRIIGPNCLGTHSSPGRLGFIADAPYAVGGVAVVSQSGGLSVDFLRLGAARGVAFHSVTSIGNSSDVNAAELVSAFLDDPDVRVIGLYLESLTAARGVLDVLAAFDQPPKPVVLLAGGRTSGGARAATSHTGALAGNQRLWPAMARQAGVILVDTLEAFLDVLAGLDTANLDSGVDNRDVILFGNGGGASVLAADALDRNGLAIPLLSDETIAAIDALGLPPGNGLANPIDVPAGTLAVKAGAVAGDILQVALDAISPAAVITHLNVGIIQRNLAATHGDVTGNIIDSLGQVAAGRPSHQILVLKTDGLPDTEEQIAGYRTRARQLGIPVFATFEQAALVTSALLDVQRTTPATQENRRVS